MKTNDRKITLLRHAYDRVRRLCQGFTNFAHDFGHAQRVAKWAAYIAKKERHDIFAVELAAILHDIGRTLEQRNPGKTHHELSYELCRQWFRTDKKFSILTKTEKQEILYDIRYHGNDEANKYMSAIILRDADKIDGLGKVGLIRSRQYTSLPHARQSYINDLRLRYHTVQFVRTKTGKTIVKRHKLFAPFVKKLRQLNKKNIKPITLYAAKK